MLQNHFLPNSTILSFKHDKQYNEEFKTQKHLSTLILHQQTISETFI